jgi:hypothetical protein
MRAARTAKIYAPSETDKRPLDFLSIKGLALIKLLFNAPMGLWIFPLILNFLFSPPRVLTSPNTTSFPFSPNYAKVSSVLVLR